MSAPSPMPPSTLSDGQYAFSSDSAGPTPTDPATAASDKATNPLEISKKDDKASGKKNWRAPPTISSDNKGRGLRQYSKRVCEKLVSKGKTTYKEVARELVAEFTGQNNNFTFPDLNEVKNIQRRVYDVLNVLTAVDILSRDKNKIEWKGIPKDGQNDIEELKAERSRLRSQIQKKTLYLRELSNHLSDLQKLKQRNQEVYGSTNVPGRVELPFTLLQTRPQGTLELEISEDKQFVKFNFNSTPFELHGDSDVLEAMRGQNEGDQKRSSDGHRSSSFPVGVCQPDMSRPLTTPPLPGIIKASRAKRPPY